MSLRTKRTEADQIRDLARSQDRDIDDAEAVVATRGAGPAPISIRLSEPLLQRLDKMAAREHRTRSNLIQHVLWEYIHETERRKRG